MKQKDHVIYKTINLINDKFYIGKDEYNNPNYFGSGIHLKNAIGKYGKENFRKEILDFCISSEELCEKEIFWIEKTKAIENGYNIAYGGRGGCTTKGRKCKEETKRKISLAQKGMIKHTEETKRKISESSLSDKNGFAIKGLDRKNIISLLLEKGLSYKEISENLGISIVPVKRIIKEELLNINLKDHDIHENIEICQICGWPCVSLNGLANHSVQKHGISKKDYYDKFLKKENEGICERLCCENECTFISITLGYSKHCSCKCSAINRFDSKTNT